MLRNTASIDAAIRLMWLALSRTLARRAVGAYSTTKIVPAPLLLVALAAAAVLALPSTASAYIGPGAGFALLSSFFVLLTTMVLSLIHI